jgi:hypothetical protein
MMYETRLGAIGCGAVRRQHSAVRPPSRQQMRDSICGFTFVTSRIVDLSVKPSLRGIGCNTIGYDSGGAVEIAGSS